MRFAVTLWIFYNFQIQKRIVSKECIWGNTVFVCDPVEQADTSEGRFWDLLWKVVLKNELWFFFSHKSLNLPSTDETRHSYPFNYKKITYGNMYLGGP
jgi:hypothetical protein